MRNSVQRKATILFWGANLKDLRRTTWCLKQLLKKVTKTERCLRDKWRTPWSRKCSCRVSTIRLVMVKIRGRDKNQTSDLNAWQTLEVISNWKQQMNHMALKIASLLVDHTLHTRRISNVQQNLSNSVNNDPLTRDLAVLREKKRSLKIKHSGLKLMQSSANTTRTEMDRSKSENCPKT